MISKLEQSNRRLTRTVAFTLVELLLVMSIIAVLASLSLVVVNEAQYDAQANATRSRISQIESLLNERLEEYQYMRTPVNPRDYTNQPLLVRELRRRIIAEIVNAEMPQDPSVDIDLDVATFPSAGFRDWVTMNSPDVDMAVINDFAARRPAFADRFNGTGATTNAELLSLILQMSGGSGISAVEALGRRAFSNVAGGPVSEVIDFWQQPITFCFQIDPDGDGIFAATTMNFGVMDVVPEIQDIRIRLISIGGLDPDRADVVLALENCEPLPEFISNYTP